MGKYQVIVGNIGTVYDGDDYNAAKMEYNDYRSASLQGYGRAAGEEVTMFDDGEIASIFPGTGEDND